MGQMGYKKRDGADKQMRFQMHPVLPIAEKGNIFFPFLYCNNSSLTEIDIRWRLFKGHYFAF